MTLYRMRFIALVTAALSFGVFARPASAAGSVSFVGTGDFATPSFEPGQGSVSSKAGYGAGLLITMPLTRHFGLEFGGLYVTRKYDESDSGITSDQHAIQVPVLLRLRFNRFISFGAGGYYAKTLGNITTTSDVTGVATNSDPGSLGYKNSDYGLVGSIALHVPLSYTCDLLLDGRYIYGLDNEVNNAALAGLDSMKFRDAQAVIGLTFHMMRGR